MVMKVDCKTVLVVEDDPAARLTLCDILADEGYHCLEAADGREAIERLAQAEVAPCVILLDLMMPGMNGWQFLEWMQRSGSHPGIPVVVLSAMPDGAAEAKRLAAASFIPKPVPLDALLESVERHCA
jgi:CheY-like chemotaxis protein